LLSAFQAASQNLVQLFYLIEEYQKGYSQTVTVFAPELKANVSLIDTSLFKQENDVTHYLQ
jgi:hypothetical protein